MREVYGRRYSLVAGRPERFKDTLRYPQVLPEASATKDGKIPTAVFNAYVNDLWTDSDATRVGLDRTVIPPEFREWTDLQFTADIQSDKQGKSESTANSTIKIWNMAPDERDFLEKGMVIILRAGYDQDVGRRANRTLPEYLTEQQNEVQRSIGSETLPLLFIGDIVTVYTEKEAENTVTTLLCKDSAVTLKQTRVSRSYPRATTYRQVIEDLVNVYAAFGVKVGSIYFAEEESQPEAQGTLAAGGINLFSNLVNNPSPFLMDSQLPGGFSAYGNLSTVLQNICDSIGYRSYIVLGKLYIEPKVMNATKPIVEIDNEDDLYYIKRIEDQSQNNEGNSVETTGVEIAMPLDASFNVAHKLRINNGFYKGTRDITSVKFKLDYEGNDWDTIIEAGTK